MTSRTPTDTPYRPAHAAIELDASSGVDRLVDTAAIEARYRLGGPHATVVMPIATPGQVGDDLGTRWSATRSDLRRLGAPDAVLDRLEQAIGVLPPCGYDALLTANADSAAYCWLTARSATSEAAVRRVGDAPSLIPAFVEVNRRPRVVAAAVDRVGGDLYSIDHAQIDDDDPIDGEHEGIHKSSGQGADQARNQRHSEVIWRRNAQLVADGLTKLADETDAKMVVLTGDRRATDLVTEHLASRPDLTVATVRAGGRHEPDTDKRLLAAALDAATGAQQRARLVDLERLDEELGQADRAVTGRAPTEAAIAEHRVKVLFVDTDSWTDRPHIDETICAATSTGASVVTVDKPDLSDGVGALLRTGPRKESTE